MARRQLIAGNWKMNGLQAARGEARALVERLGGRAPDDADVLICPPATLLADLARDLAGSGVAAGGQDCHAAPSGAHTGDISAEMLADAGAAYVVVGHSERRALGETDALIRAKGEAAIRAGLIPVMCVGETEQERDAGRAEAVVTGQINGSLPEGGFAAGLVIAYEPVWAIGTGRTPTTADIAAMHAAIRATLAQQAGQAGGDGTRILYGGSVKPGNAAEILAIADVDGALVGGASLKASDFHAIIAARPAP
ncbi:MAG: triose-phosphate isomerase [Caulobacterales bacterium]|nr:triose-phosphate isomerase [Caulobacterales bacterium]